MAEGRAVPAAPAQDLKALQLALYACLGPFTRALVDNQRVGAGLVLLNRTINTTDTSITIRLDRTPSGFLVIRNRTGGVVYDGSHFGSDWSQSAIVLRATIQGVYSLIVV